MTQLETYRLQKFLGTDIKVAANGLTVLLIIEKVRELARVAYAAEDGSAIHLDQLIENISYALFDVDGNYPAEVCATVLAYVERN